MLTFRSTPFDKLTIEELYAILRLRAEIFVVEQDCPYQDLDNKDQSCFHLSGFDTQGELVAYTRLVPKGISYPNHLSIGRVVTSEKVRGTGAGKILMQKSITELERLFGKHPVKISAQCYLEEFYRSFNFEPVGEEYLEDDIPHIAMIRR